MALLSARMPVNVFIKSAFYYPTQRTQNIIVCTRIFIVTSFLIVANATNTSLLVHPSILKKTDKATTVSRTSNISSCPPAVVRTFTVRLSDQTVGRSQWTNGVFLLLSACLPAAAAVIVSVCRSFLLVLEMSFLKSIWRNNSKHKSKLFADPWKC